MAIWDFSALGAPIGRLLGLLASRPILSVAGALLGEAESGEQVVWPMPTPERAGHAVVLGASGCGKSVMIASAAIQQLKTDRSMSLAVIDAKSDLVKYVLAGLAAEAPERLADVRLLRPFRLLPPSRAAVPLNLCRLPRSARSPVGVRALQLAGLVSRMSTTAVATKVGIGARQLDLLTNVISAVFSLEDHRVHPLMALDAIGAEDGLRLLSELTSASEAGFALSGMKVSSELAASTASRLRSAFALTESIASMFCSTDCADWSKLLGPGRICLIDLGGPPGGQASLLSFFCGLFVSLVADHLLSRTSPYNGHHCSLIIDEAQLAASALAGGVGETLLSIGRSLRISLTLMSQATAIIAREAPGLLEIVNANAPLKLVGRLAPQDAEFFARSVSPRPGTSESRAAIRSRFAGSVANLPDRAFFQLTPGGRRRFRSRDVDVNRWLANLKRVDVSSLEDRVAVDVTHPRLRLTDLVAGRRAAPVSQPPAASPWG